MQQVLAAREKTPLDQQRALLLFSAENEGHDWTPQLIEIARKTAQAWPYEAGAPVLIELLHLSDDPRDYKRYLEWLEKIPTTFQPYYGWYETFGEVQGSSFHAQMLIGLHPKHRAEYSRRVWKLLQSASLAERQTGEQALKAVFKDAVFEAEEFADRRAAMLSKLRPFLAH